MSQQQQAGRFALSPKRAFLAARSSLKPVVDTQANTNLLLLQFSSLGARFIRAARDRDRSAKLEQETQKANQS